MEEAQLKSDNPKKAMIEKDDSLPIQNNIVDVKLDEQQETGSHGSSGYDSCTLSPLTDDSNSPLTERGADSDEVDAGQEISVEEKTTKSAESKKRRGKTFPVLIPMSKREDSPSPPSATPLKPTNCTSPSTPDVDSSSENELSNVPLSQRMKSLQKKKIVPRAPVFRKKQSKADRDILEEMENPKPSTSAPLRREIERNRRALLAQSSTESVKQKSSSVSYQNYRSNVRRFTPRKRALNDKVSYSTPLKSSPVEKSPAREEEGNEEIELKTTPTPNAKSDQSAKKKLKLTTLNKKEEEEIIEDSLPPPPETTTTEIQSPILKPTEHFCIELLFLHSPIEVDEVDVAPLNTDTTLNDQLIITPCSSPPQIPVLTLIANPIDPIEPVVPAPVKEEEVNLAESSEQTKPCNQADIDLTQPFIKLTRLDQTYIDQKTKRKSAESTSEEESISATHLLSNCQSNTEIISTIVSGQNKESESTPQKKKKPRGRPPTKKTDKKLPSSPAASAPLPPISSPNKNGNSGASVPILGKRTLVLKLERLSEDELPKKVLKQTPEFILEEYLKKRRGNRKVQKRSEDNDDIEVDIEAVSDESSDIVESSKQPETTPKSKKTTPRRNKKHVTEAVADSKWKNGFVHPFNLKSNNSSSCDDKSPDDPTASPIKANWEHNSSPGTSSVNSARRQSNRKRSIRFENGFLYG
ncbi:AF4/FMR2 family member 4 isoform X1 [Folsomia candida]|uniref:AF4/FMR2 family member 4 isoform X1 n=1 Tax=Folsomia candida TaxID=158441 RepID=UPI000B903C42|nr:AF4/FMR2 family member 4 isoform X1 [Folsomia candida]XP_021957706.1 AF4/FMR2 family member 4 isoform X1 [Folsomia candida]XP_035710912.1 AF4/FMR2 family member 4 isoform X1 [Folsomia candida]